MKTDRFSAILTRNVLGIYAIYNVSSNKRPPPSQRKVMCLINARVFIRIFTVGIESATDSSNGSDNV